MAYYKETKRDDLFEKDYQKESKKTGKPYPSTRLVISAIEYEGEQDNWNAYTWEAVLITNFKLTTNQSGEVEIAKKVRNGRAVDDFSQVRMTKEQFSDLGDKMTELLWS